MSQVALQVEFRAPAASTRFQDRRLGRREVTLMFFIRSFALIQGKDVFA